MPKFCPNCGAGLVDDKKYCRKCGSSLMTAELTARRDPRSRQLGSTEVGARADTVRNLDPNTGEMTGVEDGGTRTIGSPGLPSSALPGGTQRMEGSKTLEASGPTATAGFGVLPQSQPAPAEPAAAKKSFPIVALLSIVVILLAAVLGVGYWLYTRARNASASSASNAAPQESMSQQAAGAAGSSSTPEATGSAATAPGNVVAANNNSATTPNASREQREKNASQTVPSTSSGETAKPSESESASSKPAETNKNQSVSSAVTQTKTITADDHIKAGLKAFDSGAYSQPVSEYTAAASLQPSNADVHCLLGLSYEKLKRPADALAEYQKCTSGPYAAVSKQHVKRLSK